MTIDHPIRRLLARVCSDRTMALVVDPVLADMRWESGPRWLGYLALVRALTVHAIVSLPGAASRACSEDDFAMARIALFSGLASLVLALPVVAPTFRLPEAGAWLLLMPQALVWTLPPVLLLAVPVALRGQPVSARITRRTIALGFTLAAVTFALVLWVAPMAFERYREIEAVFIKPGNDFTVSDFPRWSAAPAARLIDYEFHQRLAFGFAALPFAVLGLALASFAAVRRLPLAIGAAAAIAYVFLAFPLALWTSALLLRASAVPPSLLAWTPNVVILATGWLLLARNAPRRSPSTQH